MAEKHTLEFTDKNGKRTVNVLQVKSPLSEQSFASRIDQLHRYDSTLTTNHTSVHQLQKALNTADPERKIYFGRCCWESKSTIAKYLCTKGVHHTDFLRGYVPVSS